MTATVDAVMRHVRNYFEREPVEGGFAITGNGLSPAPDAPWVAIRGSKYHDGVYELAGGYLQGVPDGMEDEEFEGLVYPLHPPVGFIALCKEIDAYNAANPVSAMQSESFGAYSYTRASGAAGGVMGWQEAFGAQLVPYRRMFPGVL